VEKKTRKNVPQLSSLSRLMHLQIMENKHQNEIPKGLYHLKAEEAANFIIAKVFPSKAFTQDLHPFPPRTVLRLRIASQCLTFTYFGGKIVEPAVKMARQILFPLPLTSDT
jgi:hypothetical protein